MKIDLRLTIITLLLVLVSTSGKILGEEVRFTASAPSTVIVDKPFQLSYTVNASAKDLIPGDLNNFEVLAGPFKTQSSSYQIVNGKSSSSVSLTFTYTLLASKTGTYTISAASITVDGQKYTSNGLSIKVLPADSNNDPSSEKANKEQKNTTNSSVSNEQIFIRTSVSKTQIYEQEPILVTYKLYTLVDVTGLSNIKLPDFNGFMKQEFDLNQNKQLSYDNFNGKNYGTITLNQVLLFPQRSGEIVIDKAQFDAVIRMQTQKQIRSIFDDFFDSYTSVNKTLIAPGSRITVKPLPTPKPASFSGAVGHLSMNSTLSASSVKANEAITLKVLISGSGNLKMIKNPEIKFPDGFESYDPKVTNNFKTTAAGISGNKIIEYMFIPRHAGEFEIPETLFSYFDLVDHSYKTLQIPKYKISVAKDEGGESTVISNNYIPKEDIKQLGNDIRYIETNNFDLTKNQSMIVGSAQAWLIYLIPLFISLILFFVLKKRTIENADILSVKNRKANKLARKRLTEAQRLLKKGKKDQFYEEVLKAVWTYLSDKLSIPVASLTKDKVNEELSKRLVSKELTDEVIQILNTCEFARYAPNTGQQEMGDLYNQTIELISKIENQIKK